jgi:dUTP pyrophosphatase
MNVKIKRLNENAVIPKYAHATDAGFDLVATGDVIIEPGETKIVPTGLAFAIPEGYEMQIRPRSGITLNTKLRVQLGTVDSGYSGEVGVIIDNVAGIEGGETPRVRNLQGKTEYLDGTHYYKYSYIIRKGDRIAQAVINRIEKASFITVGELDKTERGEGGYGSSGVSEDEAKRKGDAAALLKLLREVE